MPTVFLVGGGPVEDLTPLVFDATTSVVPNRSSTVTKHPVETGVTITDHIFRNNTTIQVEGYITNNAVAGIRDQYTNDRTQTVYDLLTQLHRDRQLVAVSHRFEVFTDCAIVSLNLPDTPQLGGILHVTMTLEQLQVVESEFVQVEGLQSRVNVGQKTPVSSENPANSTEQTEELSRIERVLRSTFPEVTEAPPRSLVPLSTGGDYQQSVVLEDTSYDLGLQYNQREAAWYADIGPSGFDPVLTSVKVATNSDALGNFQHLVNIPSGYLSVIDLETGIGRVNREEFNEEGRYRLLYMNRQNYDRIVSGVSA